MLGVLCRFWLPAGVGRRGRRAAGRGGRALQRSPSSAAPPACIPACLPSCLQSFLLSELGTSGSLDGTQRLIVKGRFLPKAFETVLRRWVLAGWLAGLWVLAGWSWRGAAVHTHLHSTSQSTDTSTQT